VSNVLKSDILFEVKDGLGLITLNRPKALNALTHGMILELEKGHPGWEKDPAVKAVVLRGAGDRASAPAATSPTSIARAARIPRARCGATSSRRVHRQPPHLPLRQAVDLADRRHRHGRRRRPSVHGSHSVASEKFLFAMPRRPSASFPDVGGGYFLTRLQGALGTFLALTSHRLKVADAVWAGIVDAHVPSARMGELQAALAAADLSGPDANRKVDAVIARFAADAGMPDAAGPDA
jgi:enoyl-CoA hydratase/carnithine racemase